MMARAFIFVDKKLMSWFNRMRELNTGLYRLNQELFLFNSGILCWPTNKALMIKLGKLNQYCLSFPWAYLKHVELWLELCICFIVAISLLSWLIDLSQSESDSHPRADNRGIDCSTILTSAKWLHLYNMGW